MKDFLKPNCKALSAPKLDEQVKDQLKRKDPVQVAGAGTGGSRPSYLPLD